MDYDDPISQLVQMYKYALLRLRVQMRLSQESGLVDIPLPKIQAVQRAVEPSLEAEFRVYERSLEEGHSPIRALETLLASFPTAD